MKVDVEELSPVETKILVEVPRERVDDEIEDAYADVNKKARVPGFRPGKVPRKHLERMFHDYVTETVASKLIKETVQTALERKQIMPVSEPRIEPGELKAEQPFIYTMRIEVRPRVEAKNYNDLKTYREVYSVSEELVDKALSEIQERHAVFKDTDSPRPARKGDYLLLDFQATQAGNPLPAEKHENMPYPLGEDIYIPDLSSHLEGMVVSEARTFTVSFPENHPRTDLAGKEVEYTVHLKELKEKILPPLDDELAREAGEYSSLEELREKTRESLKRYYERLSRIRFERRLLDLLLEGNPVPVPPSMVIRRSRELTAQNLQQMGVREIKPEEFESLAEKFREQAERDVQAGFLLEAISRQENIEVTEDETRNRIEELAKEEGIHPDKMRDRLADEESRSRINAYLLEQKTLDFLAKRAKIEDRQVDPEKTESVEEKR